MPNCECCEKQTNYFLESMYTREAVKCICPECVVSGKAAEKFNGEFVQDAEDDIVNDEEKRQELEALGIVADEIFEEYDARCEYEYAREYLEKKGSMAGHLFQCLHCGKYHLWVDAE